MEPEPTLLSERAELAYFGVVAGQLVALPDEAANRHGRLVDYLKGAAAIPGAVLDQCALRPVGINCWLPRAGDDRAVPILGTAAVEATRLGDDVLSVTATTWFQGRPSGNSTKWSEVRRNLGGSVIARDPGNSVDKLTKRFLNSKFIEEDGTLSLDAIVSDTISRIRRGYMRELSVPARRFQVTIVARRTRDDKSVSNSHLGIANVETFLARGIGGIDTVHVRGNSWTAKRLIRLSPGNSHVCRELWSKSWPTGVDLIAPRSTAGDRPRW